MKILYEKDANQDLIDENSLQMIDNQIKGFVSFVK